MATEIIELRQMLEGGHSYLAGACSIQELNGRVSYCADAAKFWGGHPAISQIVADWGAMIDRRWNECGHSPNPVSEQEFRAWLEQQLTALGQAPNNSFKPKPLRRSA